MGCRPRPAPDTSKAMSTAALHAARAMPLPSLHAESPFEFVSSVDAGLWKDVEALFYFHPRQPVLIESIKACVEEFGAPEILQRGDRIHVGIPKNGAQCLFACHRERRPGVPVAVAVYLRTRPEVLHILHLAVHPAYEQGGQHAELDLALQLVGQVRQLARRISGVRRVQLPYRRAGFLSVPPLGATH